MISKLLHETILSHLNDFCKYAEAFVSRLPDKINVTLPDDTESYPFLFELSSLYSVGYLPNCFLKQVEK